MKMMVVMAVAMGGSHVHAKCYGISRMHGHDELETVDIVEHLSIIGTGFTYLHEITIKI